MPMPALWLVLLVIFGIVEAATVGLTSIWFAAGALVAMVAALLHAPLWAQIVLFLAVSFVALLLMRPLAKKYLTPSFQPTNADRIIGQEAVVTETIDNLKGRGLVSVDGTVWTARAEDEEPIAAGTVVKVLLIVGFKVFVEAV